MKRLAALAAFKLSLFLQSRVNEDCFRRYSHLIVADATQEELDAYDQEAQKLFEDDPNLAVRYETLCDLCGGDPIAITAVQLYLLALMDGRTLQLLRETMGSEEPLNIETAGRLTYRDRETLEMVPALYSAFRRVEILLQADPSQPVLSAPFRLDGRLAAWLQGDDTPDCGSVSCQVATLDEPLAPASLTEEAVLRTARLLRHSGGFSLVHVAGEVTSGRKHFARHTARALGRELLMIPFDQISEDGVLRPRAWRAVLRELMLTDRLLCLHGLSLPPEKRLKRLPGLLRQLEEDLAALKAPVFLTTDEPIKVTPFTKVPVYTVHIPAPNILQSAALWRELARRYLSVPQSFPAESMAAKMHLTAGQMERIVQLLHVCFPTGEYQERDIFKLCYQVLDDGRYENIRFVDTSFGWEDLQLDDALKGALEAVCAQVEHQGLVLDEWGLRRQYPYGRCVSVLMSGPPGTGKTMTAQVLAARLGLELYKVDLSQIVDKYIGETEKRLKQVFDQAEKSNMILFFDEADALLGKRSEVKEAKDKYANTEVAYLLQRMEEYQGVVLMATNQAGNMDSAFLRRFRYHLVFTLPDENMRRKLWADALEHIPAQGIQLDYLARQFELSGAQIKNIALNGAYQAAADGGVLRMSHLVRAIFQEFQKEGKVMLASDFGEYGVMLSDYLSAKQT